MREIFPPVRGQSSPPGPDYPKLTIAPPLQFHAPAAPTIIDRALAGVDPVEHLALYLVLALCLSNIKIDTSYKLESKSKLQVEKYTEGKDDRQKGQFAGIITSEKHILGCKEQTNPMRLGNVPTLKCDLEMGNITKVPGVFLSNDLD
ncbi:hypothetical protein GH714_007066 [Hevea brasiliensis]|uniref:Uncharacterized protein n=1 Tax=Hevea brasiliensis TaxID=3981 RepID=A0A6A6N9Q2_HEVBR|nr:hypothetical protein GH714_007066 [Hevea brasiliensis]